MIHEPNRSTQTITFNYSFPRIFSVFIKPLLVIIILLYLLQIGLIFLLFKPYNYQLSLITLFVLSTCQCIAAAFSILSFILAGTAIMASGEVSISPIGIQCQSFWGKYHFVEWSKISQVKFTNFFGFKYLLISSPNQPQLRMLLFISEPQNFRDFATQYAGQDHLFTIHLNRHLGINLKQIDRPI